MDKLLFISSSCPLKCSYCDLNIDTEKEFMSLENIENIFSSVKEDDYFVLSGGEPTGHPDWKQILELAVKYKIKGQIISNSYSYQKIKMVIDMMKNKGFGLRLNLSISDVSENKLDPKDNLVWKSIQKLLKLKGVKAFKDKITLSVVYTNTLATTEVLKFATSNDFSVTMNLPTQINFPQEYANYHRNIDFDVADARSFHSVYSVFYNEAKSKGKEWFISPDSLLEHIDRYENKDFWRCEGQNHSVKTFYPRGYVGGCCMTTISPKDCPGCISTCDLEIFHRRYV